MSILDRYIVREIILPFVIALLVFTFILIIPFIIDLAETMIAKGVPWPTILRLMATLLPATARPDHPDGAADRPSWSRSAGCRATARSW